MAGQLERLSPQDCIQAYAETFQTDRRHVILVTGSNNYLMQEAATSTLVASASEGGLNTTWHRNCPSAPFSWICDQAPVEICNDRPQCISTHKAIDPLHWTVQRSTVQYCLSENVAQTCRLRFNLGLAVVVIVFNLLKAVAIFATWRISRKEPLLTMGDAIASFLLRSDDCTKTSNWLESYEIKPLIDLRTRNFTRQRWSQSVSRTSWVGVYILFSIILVGITGLLIYGISNTVDTPRSILLADFGGLNPSTFISGWKLSTIIQNVLIANMPQVILSIIYVQYNGVLTGMMLGAEWNGYASKRKGLRVSSHPAGAQRSTYFLQLPYRAALPLMALSATLHWLCSQSLFLVSITMTRVDDYDHDFIGERITTGYSAPAILAVIATGVIMLLVLFLVGRRRYPNIMPVAGSCSLAISAACHPTPGKEGREDPTLPVQWGRSEEQSNEETKEGHYSFSSWHVFPFAQEP